MYLRSVSKWRKENDRRNAAHTDRDIADIWIGINYIGIDYSLVGDVLKTKSGKAKGPPQSRFKNDICGQGMRNCFVTERKT